MDRDRYNDLRAEYERGFIDGMQKQMQSSVDRAVNAMAKREWVGLTDEEIQDLGYLSEKFDASNSEYFDRWGFAQAIEAKLKEKNT